MFYLREQHPPLWAGDKAVMDQQFYEFDVKKEDYFLKQFISWDRISTDIYTMQTDRGQEFYVPAGFYVFVGSEDGSVDWVLSDELVDRDIETFVISAEFNRWELKVMRVTAITPHFFYYPFTKNPVPITNMNANEVIIISSVDQYHKLKKHAPSMFFSIDSI